MDDMKKSVVVNYRKCSMRNKSPAAGGFYQSINMQPQEWMRIKCSSFQFRCSIHEFSFTLIDDYGKKKNTMIVK